MRNGGGRSAARIYGEARPLYHPLVTRDLDKLGLVEGASAASGKERP
jgi:hypothetical protein